MPIALTFEPRAYVLKRERELPSERQTTFLLRPLRHAQREEAAEAKWRRDQATGELLIVSNGYRRARKILNGGLVGWERLLDRNGGLVPFPSVTDSPARALPDEALDALGDDVLELADEVWRISELSDADQKKS